MSGLTPCHENRVVATAAPGHYILSIWFYFLSSPPLTTIGKVDKNALRDLERTARVAVGRPQHPL